MRSANHSSRALLVAALVLGPVVATASPASASHALSMARSDSYATATSTPLTVGAPGLLANDDGSYGGLRFHDVVSAPANGVVAVASDGSFTYTPTPGYIGVDTFTYRSNDSLGTPSNVGTVSIRVDNVPVANDDAFTVDEDETLTVPAPGALANDTDADGTALTMQVVQGVQRGTLTPAADGSFTYVPAANFHGADSFTYRAWDGVAWSGTATVALTVTSVNDAPVAAADSYLVAGGGSLTVAAPGVVGNDGDVEGDPLTVVSVGDPSNGEATVAPNGSFTYTPDTGFKGTDTFTYRASDGSATSAPVTVSLSVANTAPVALDDAWDTNEDRELSWGDVLGNDSDANPTDTLTADLVAGPSDGDLTLEADGTFVYMPDQDFHGTDSFTYTATDGSDVSEVATVTLTVTPSPDAPVVVSEDVSMAEDTVRTAVLQASDVDGDVLTYSVVDSPRNGELVLDTATGEYTYTPDPDFVGTDQIGFYACDPLEYCGSNLINITVTPVDDAPVAGDQTVSTLEDTALTALFDIADPDSWAFDITVLTPPAHGDLVVDAPMWAFTYTPATDWSGTDTFEVSVCDETGLCDTATVTVTVASVSDVPSAPDLAITTAEDTATSGRVEFVDADSSSVVVGLADAPEHGTVLVEADGSFVYAPLADVSGTDSFTVEGCDAGGLCGTAVVDVVITPVNDTPTVVVVGGASRTGQVGVPVTVDGLASDAEQGLLTVGWNQTDGPSVAFGPRGSTLTFTPEVVGSHTFQVVACDAQELCGTATVTVVVAAAAQVRDGSGGGSTSGGLATTGVESATAALASMLLLTVGGVLVGVRRRAARG